MTIKLYNTTSEINMVTKELTELATLTGNLREESSIIDPVIIVDGIGSYLATCNYAYIPEFSRYYFIQNIETVSNTLYRLHLHVDVLYTYRNGIRDNYAIISRNEKQYDLKMNDGLFVTQQNPRRAQFPFPSGFNTWNYVLAIAGN